MFLYKYTSLKNAMLLLNELTFHCSDIDTFNDPFEGKFIYGIGPKNFARNIAITLSIGKPIIVTHKGICEILSSSTQNEITNAMRGLYDILSKHYKNKTIINKETYYQVESEIYDFIIKSNFLEIMSTDFLDIISPTSTANSFMQITIKELGILCLSKSKNHPLMWAHYANNHSGVMFEIDTSKNLFIDGTSSFSKEVRYVNKIPTFTNDTILGINRKLFPTENEEMMQLHLATKSEHWNYEDEVRYMVNKGTPPNNKKKLNPNAIAGVYMGLQTPTESKKTISHLIQEKFPSTLMFETFLSEDSYDLESRELSLK